MKKILFILTILIASATESRSCSCILVHFCQYVQDTTVKIAIQGRVISNKTYSDDNQAVYMQVLKKYKEDILITDTIKVYGGPNEAACDVDVLWHFQVGDTVLLAFGYVYYYPPVVNPDSLHENYFGLRPQLCNIVELHVFDGIVNGAISPDVWQYPLDHFNDALHDCSFTTSVHPEQYAGNHINVYPNPSADGKVYLQTDLPVDLIDRIRVFSVDGRLVREMTGLNNGSVILLDTGDLGNGLYVLEIQCGAKMLYRKLEVRGEK
ncbi:MAG TPA: T9SS type A sorting domain-containing protein [Saprospiraceae bacterium]|nr:T9SS type A sorting domain-containing protein [Saprospiraceae bacterium]HPI07268.1 T9SS type A sorting domain-containing protein [Saprospiraceae bacterium]